MDIREKLSKIQQEMKAPKNQHNNFGNYDYRNAEGILEAFKPFEDKYSVFITLNDEIIPISDRVYVKATANLIDVEANNCISTSAWAREPESKKGMDAPQITGTASSYARKYALNGLLLLDDNKDADTDEYHNQTTQASHALNPKKNKVQDICNKYHLNVYGICKANNINWNTINEEELDCLIKSLQNKYGDN